MKRLWMVAMMAAVLVSGGAYALTEADLTEAKIQAAMAAKPAAQRQAFARQVLEAVAARPTDEASKAGELLMAARALLTAGGSIGTISEIFNTVPVEHLQAVAELLGSENFEQTSNRMSDAQYDAFCAKVVSAASRYIEASGSDSPTVRMSILAATFSKNSTDPERTRPQMIAALPPAMQAAAATYIEASEWGNLEVLAAASGVDEVTETPPDPGAERVVTVAAADEEGEIKPESDYLEPQPPKAEVAGKKEAEEETPSAKVPILARFATDVTGLTMDTMFSAMYDWEQPSLMLPTMINATSPEQMVGAGEFGLANQVRPMDPPSPSYGNQTF